MKMTLIPLLCIMLFKLHAALLNKRTLPFPRVSHLPARQRLSARSAPRRAVRLVGDLGGGGRRRPGLAAREKVGLPLEERKEGVEEGLDASVPLGDIEHHRVPLLWVRHGT